MNLLVTGGAGFIGSHFVRTVLADALPGLASARVTVLDKLTYAGNFANLGEVAESDRLDFLPGDIVPARVDGRGLRVDRRGRVHGTVAAVAHLPVRRHEGRLRHAGAGVPPDPSGAGRGDPMRQQLRPVSAPGEGDPAVRDEPAHRPHRPVVRRRQPDPRLVHVDDHCRAWRPLLVD